MDLQFSDCFLVGELSPVDPRAGTAHFTEPVLPEDHTQTDKTRSAISHIMPNGQKWHFYSYTCCTFTMQGRETVLLQYHWDIIVFVSFVELVFIFLFNFSQNCSSFVVCIFNHQYINKLNENEKCCIGNYIILYNTINIFINYRILLKVCFSFSIPT